MREREMRHRLAEFFRRTARTVVLPASLGLGLAGCGDARTVNQPGDDSGPPVPAMVDAGPGAVPPSNMDYAAPFPEADAGLTPDSSPVPPNAAMYAAAFPGPGLDGGADALVPPNNLDYAAPFPEPDFGSSIRYGAPFDAG